MNEGFVHLRTKSHYSLLQAVPKIDALVEAAKKDGQKALALTDINNLYGAIEFYKECKDRGIQPIVGVEFSLAKYSPPKNPSRLRQTESEGKNSLVLLSRNAIGYHNLIKLVTSAQLDHGDLAPILDWEFLDTHHEGLLAIIPLTEGELAPLLENHHESAQEILAKYQKTFGEFLYLEARREKNNPLHENFLQGAVQFAKENHLPLVATNNVRYLSKDDQEVLEVVLGIGGFRSTHDHIDGEAPDFSFLSQEEMSELFSDLPEALENSIQISEICQSEIPLGKWMFPTIEIASGTNDEELRRITYEGLSHREMEKTKEVEERIEYELGIIKQKGYASYFLVVADLLRYAHDNGILTTTRGSAGGSLVSYLSGITTVDPMKYLLPFERFLNPARPSAPDIDLDIADNRRDEMIEYVRKKYGKDRMAQIGTFGTMMARGAVRDVTRALGYPYGLGDRIAKIIPFGSQGFPMTIEHALETTPELKELYESEEDVKRILDTARKIEGNARHISIHAAGVVISPVPLTEVTPLQLDPKEKTHIITQYDMYSIDEDNAGLLKFDFLGIRNLAILSDSVRLVEKLRGIKIDIENIPLDDKKTFEMLARGDTGATFQLNGSGMTRFLKELRPTRIEDINVMVALYRPGPMDNINEYIARKNGTRPIAYLHPKMKNFLDTTFGVLVYQDDLLMTAIEVAGYSWGEVDKFRKAVGKKIPEEMAKQHIIFVEGCQKHGGTSKEKAEQIWNLFEPFQGYGFNKAHAASYGKVAYQTAYMKANFPGEYMTAVLTAEAGDVDTVSEMVAECKRLKIPILPPDINESFEDFTLVKGATFQDDRIRFGLKSIKNFGEGISHSIIDERKKEGPFKTLENFLTRIKDRNLNKKSLEALVYSGTLDSLGERGVMAKNIEVLLNYNKFSSLGNDDQTSLFGGSNISEPPLLLEDCPPIPQEEKLRFEKELLGLYVSGHPLDKYQEKLKGRSMTISDMKEKLHPGMMAVATGLIEEAKPILTKNGDKMLFVRLADFSGTLEAVIFPKIYTEYKDIIVPGNCIAIKGKLSNRNNMLSIIAEGVRTL